MSGKDKIPERFIFRHGTILRLLTVLWSVVPSSDLVHGDPARVDVCTLREVILRHKVYVTV